MGQNAAGGSQTLISLLPLLLLILIMYFLMIRPQKKKDKEVQNMRNSIQVGDEIITIGGIVGKVVKTKDESLVIQVGADKVKMEIMRWAVSTCKPSEKHIKNQSTVDIDDAPEKKPIKRLKKDKPEEAAAEAKVEEAVEEASKEVVDETTAQEILEEK